jgi:malate synthase
MTEYQSRAGLQVAQPLVEFVEREGLPGTGLEPEAFWAGVDAIFRDLEPRNRELLAERDRIQNAIDDYHRAHPGTPDKHEYRDFLAEIGYLVPQGRPTIATADVDPEITSQAGPQLVVPLLNARFAVNAANARWVSLYDSLYGTDAISESGDLARGPEYNPARGDAVIAYGRALLDDVAPLASGSHADVVAYRVSDGRLQAELASGTIAELQNPKAFAGYTGDPLAPAGILLVHHHLTWMC